MLQRLAVFNGWSLEAAEAVLEGFDVTELLGGLVDKSLVEVVARSPANRYRLLETVRQYALDQLADAGNEEGARMAHATYFLDLAEHSETGLKGPDQARWLEHVKADHDNIRAAIGWALSSGRVELALRFIGAMGRFWFMQTHWKEALRWFDLASESGRDEYPLAWARAFVKTGVIELITRGGAAEPTTAEHAHQILSEHGTPSEVATATYALAEGRQGVGDASELTDRALQLYKEAGDAWGQAYASRWLGSKIELHGDPMENLEHQREGVEGFRQLGDRWSAGWLAFDLGFSLLALNRFEEANLAFEDAMELVSDGDDRLVRAHAARGMASVAAGLGRLSEARQRFLDTIPMLEQIGDENCLAFSYLYLADIAWSLTDHEQVPALLDTAVRGFTGVDNRPGIAAALRRFARHAAESGEPELAARILAASNIPDLSGGELSPPERAILDEIESRLREQIGDDDQLAALQEEGEIMPREELLERFRLHVQRDSTPEQPPEDIGAPTWPGEYDDLHRHVVSAWDVEGAILIHKSLGGKSGASVFAVDLACRGFSGQAILKLEAVDDPSGASTEAARHHLAVDKAPEFAAAHLPKVVHATGVGEATAVLSTIAGGGLEYVTPWAKAPYRSQVDVSRELARGILDDWNADYRLSDSILSPHEVLVGWLDYRLDPKRGRIHRFLEEARVRPEIPTISWAGHWYPNPLAFATALAPAPSDLGLRPITGNIHGDLHGHNVLVRRRDDDVEWFLIDLAFYTPDAFLFFDHAYFELSHLLDTRTDEPIEGWLPLLDTLAGREQALGDDIGLIELLRDFRAQTSQWAEDMEPNRLSYMESQMLLARVAVGLNFTHKRVPAGLKQRGFLYAMSALKDYIEFHGIEWPTRGDRLALEE